MLPLAHRIDMAVNPSAKYIAPTTNAQTVIKDAIDALGGYGIIILGDGTYTFSAALDLSGYSGITIRGLGPIFTNDSAQSADVFDAGRTYSAGTRLLGDGTGTYDGIVGNATDLGSPAANFADDTLQGIHLENLYFEGFNRPIKFGAQNHMGVYGSTFKNLWFLDSKGFVDFVNFAHCHFEDLYVYDSNRPSAFNETTGMGGIRWMADCATGDLIPGNSTIRQISNLRRHRNHQGIQFIATSGSKLNEITTTRLESLSFGGAGGQQVVLTVDVTNGSPWVDFQAASAADDFPVGTTLTFETTFGGFITGRTYYVVSQDTANNRIQVNNEPDLAGDNATATASGDIRGGLFSGITIHAEDSLGIVNSSFMETDTEADTANGLGVGISVNNVSNCTIQVAGSSGVMTANASVRNASESRLIANRNTYIADFGNSASQMQYDGGLRGTIPWYPGWGFWNGTYTGPSDGQTETPGSASIAGTGATFAEITGGIQTKANSTFGALRLTTGTGISANGVIGTVTWGLPKIYSVVTIVPLNAAALALMPNIHQNYTLRGTGFDIVCDVNLSDSTQYDFGYITH